MRAQRGTARRYAKAVHAIAREAGSVEAVGEELERVGEVIAAQAELRDVLGRPWVKGTDRRAAATAVAERVGCSALVRDLLGLLAERGRIDHLPEVGAAYRELVDQDQNRVRGEVRAAVALGEAEVGQLARRLEAALGKQVILEQRVDPTLLGGFVARVGSFIVDGSLDGQLERLRERLARGKG